MLLLHAMSKRYILHFTFQHMPDPLSLPDLAALAGYRRQRMNQLFRQGKIPFAPVNDPEMKQKRFEDTPDIRDWCKRVRASNAQKQPREKTGPPRLLELWPKIAASQKEVVRYTKLTCDGLAKVGNHFRKLGVLLAMLREKDGSPAQFQSRFLRANVNECQLPFTYAKARKLMNFAAENSEPITARKLGNRTGLLNEIYDIAEMV
jgi:hypothetical protein